MTKGAILA